VADPHATPDRAAIDLDVTRLPKRVLTADVIDRMTRRREAIRTQAADGALLPLYQDGYEDALDDLLDAFYGFCHPAFHIKEAP
jgi:hypothetical protein